MKHLDLLNEFKASLGQLVYEVEASASMQHYDINKVSENLVLGLFRELLDFQNIRNLNSDEKSNFPGIDLADDECRVAVQVTATPGLDKIKKTIETFLSHRLDERYDRLIVYVLTRKQDSYSKSALDRVCESRLKFDSDRDVLDFRDLASMASELNPHRLQKALEAVRSYQRGGIPLGLSQADIDPPTSSFEKVNLNLIEIYFPPTLYIGDLIGRDTASRKNQHNRDERQVVREKLKELGLRAPSDYVVNAQRLISFHHLDDSNGPFRSLVDMGTVTPLGSKEFAKIDDDHNRIFKSLLRFALQQKLFKRQIHWKHKESLFVFMPLENGDLFREETWTGYRQSTRTVFEKKLSKTDVEKVFYSKHFAFEVDFLEAGSHWYMALTPDWFFSYGDDFRKSFYADEHVSWLKRNENNRSVSDHFRFLASWLRNLDQEDMFLITESSTTTLTFGDAVSFNNHPKLNDEAWLPLRNPAESDSDKSPLGKLFGAS